MTPELLALLRSIDTPTVCNAIEVAQGKRGFSDFTRGTPVSSDENGVVVGYARTAAIAGNVPSLEDPDVLKARRLDYYRHMAEGDGPNVAVIEDRDFPDCTGAWWGEVNTTVHKGLGLSGAVTNGVMRDLGDLAPGYPVIAGSVGPSHAFVRVEEVAGSVEVFGLRVKPDDLIHADRHGAAIIPQDMLADLPSAVATLQSAEDLILGPARQGGFDLEKLQEAWARFEAART